ncbi:hypothetical protein ACFE04_010696 [Oxalis oulophora]
MKLYLVKLQNAKNTIYNSTQKIFLVILVLISLVAFPFCLDHSCLSFQRSMVSFDGFKNVEIEKECSIFKGKWIPNYMKEPYYTNLTCNLMIDQLNCAKFGRNDTDFMKWRWKPDECDLPLFDAIQFLDIVRNKSIAFVGDSLGRNQMESLIANPEDITRNYTSNVMYFRRYYYVEYNFTLATLWSPYLVKSRNNVGSSGHIGIYLDEANELWATQIEKFDYLIISGGQWFFGPLIYYENGQASKCHICNINNITSVSGFYGYKMAFRTTFRKILEMNYKGVTFLRTLSPSHFENGEWNTGGSCERTRPYGNEEMIKLDGFQLELYETQMEEFRVAQQEARIKGLKFNLINTTEIMLMRPDGHPNHHSGRLNGTLAADCVHWCLPGPIDVWNEFLLYMLKKENNR